MEFALGVIVAAIATVVVLNLASRHRTVERRIQHHHPATSADYIRELELLVGPAFVPGNAVENLENGDQIFPAMLEAIRGASQTINFETFIYWSGRIGREFAEALAERARAGVKVHVILDWLGSQKMDEELIDLMDRSGIRVVRYHRPHWYTLARMNNRTHRKLLIVDGTVGFTGGVGIADEWLGHAQDPEHWRDSHFRIEGPVVAQIQAAFLENWLEATGDLLTGEDYFPHLQPAGDMRMQFFTSSPNGGADSMELMYLLSIAAAERSIDITAAYFLPDDLLCRVLIDARRRGVRVRVLAPGEHIDRWIARYASRDDWGPLLEAGIEIHEFEPTMLHVKLLVVDRHLVSVGSTNFDPRSLYLNAEANLNVVDDAFAQRITHVFEQDLSRSRRILLDDWKHRPLKARVIERMSSLVQPQL
ncbi:MAG TPA: phospholipase D-like domain-containing protein [Steroidobacteraceae bacterium]|nr:phospholipase D-like domain-containing protein [Steroidobacteraceae bacterium]